MTNQVSWKIATEQHALAIREVQEDQKIIELSKRKGGVTLELIREITGEEDLDEYLVFLGERYHTTTKVDVENQVLVTY